MSSKHKGTLVSLEANKKESQHRMRWVGTVICAAAIILLIITFSLDATKPNYNTINTVLSAFFSILLSVGLVSFIWDSFMKKTWLQTVDLQICKSLTMPDIAEYLREDNARNKMLKELLLSLYEKALGNELYLQYKSIKEIENAKDDFIYDITLSRKTTTVPGTAKYYDAEFNIAFNVEKLVENPIIIFSRVPSSNELHNKYQALVELSKNTIYRYILLSDEECTLADYFSVIDCTVADKDSDAHVSLSAIYNMDGENLIIRLVCEENDRSAFYRIANNTPRVTLKIKTIVDLKRKAFPVFLGYPVFTRFVSSMTITDGIATHIDVLEFFTSSSQFELRPCGDAVVSIGGELQGVVLPDSGLAYTWQ
jgi:hypothetical protein